MTSNYENLKVLNVSVHNVNPYFFILGPEAALKFQYLRDGMARELKRYNEMNPQRSGQGVVDGPKPWKSSWPFHTDLTFLMDHISPRTE